MTKDIASLTFTMQKIYNVDRIIRNNTVKTRNNTTYKLVPPNKRQVE